ncbi:RsfA family transcriptional regulator [Lentibacillus amyloliquefaciens]|uniref:RsfA family transcription regulator n=1 Tax=Lentibacillus amyloliquefaciens TaxID=1472767 RepID=A0A0U3W2J0_9BACI|nr:RsfA family transcriptional regulator [Lentibacillus amyloliquefaciens]ALX47376.1 RsfA family transcription regulator [Lentibacillus amyloliquefaciens]
MNATRQDAWSKDEDILLAETVLRHIREGKTQLEAFKEVAHQLSRTSAACGFRWNASIRKTYENAIESAKEDRKQNNRQKTMVDHDSKSMNNEDPLAAAISLLEKIRTDSPAEDFGFPEDQEMAHRQLLQENKALKKQLMHYEQAWEEMGKLWNWVNEQQK